MIEYDDLQQMIYAEVRLCRYRRSKRLCKLAGVWWRYLREGNHMTLITCYGAMLYDLIDARHWCGRRKDRVNIT